MRLLPQRQESGTMNTSTNLPPNTSPVDEDLAEQARPGHGIPSQDPEPAAHKPLQPQEAQREAQPAMMGGGEVARYIARHGQSRLRSVVFAAAVPPYLMQTSDNPQGPLTPDKAQQMKKALVEDRTSFFDMFSKDFFSANGALQVTEAQRAAAVALCHQSSQPAALACMDAFATTDFRQDLKQVTVDTLVIHGEADAIVPFEGSGQRTHRAVPHSQLVTAKGAPHGLNVSHAQAFNEALLSFLRT
jgi:non-heme chloroperoxidase